MSVRVGVGTSAFPFSAGAGFWRWVEYCESSPLDSIWQTDRLVAREPFLESMTVMAALAGATERIKFGMNAIVVPFRDPLLLARQCASIDVLSGGRLLPVFGVGSERAPEWRASGRGEAAGRGSRANEALELMQQLWTQDRVDYAGKFFQYRDVSIAPRPLQQPLPCWIGGSSPAAVRRTARLGTGWLGGGNHSPEEVGRTIRAIRAECLRRGRQIDDDHYGASVAFRFTTKDAGSHETDVESLLAARERRGGSSARTRANVALGDAEQILERLRNYLDAGASKFVLIPLARGDAEMLEQTRLLAEQVVPEAHTWARPSRASSNAD